MKNIWTLYLKKLRSTTSEKDEMLQRDINEELVMDINDKHTTKPPKRAVPEYKEVSENKVREYKERAHQKQLNKYNFM